MQLHFEQNVAESIHFHKFSDMLDLSLVDKAPPGVKGDIVQSVIETQSLGLFNKILPKECTEFGMSSQQQQPGGIKVAQQLSTDLVQFDQHCKQARLCSHIGSDAWAVC